MKIVINKCYGGFGYSEKLVKEVTGMLDFNQYTFQELLPNHRTNPKVIAAIEKLGVKAASGFCAELGIIEIPDDVEYTIEKCNGMEWIAEKHRTWGD